jgi:amino acid adenylation domain-containing protein
VPTIHQALLALTGDREKLRDLRLRFIRSCSAPMPQSVLQELERVFAVPVIEAYGMTEASHQISSNPLPPLARKVGSVGLPCRTEVAITDDAGRELPRGEIGEVVLRGATVISHYSNNSEANQQSFRDGWLRTGDLGCLDEDGYLFLKGRIKEIINRGGEKISPREVDDILLEQSAVAQAVTFAVPHTTLGEDVAAAVVVRQGCQVTAKQLRDFAATRLAHFKVPSQIYLVDKIPTGPTGKLSRSALTREFGSRLGQSQPDQTIKESGRDSAVEAELKRIWMEVLGVSAVGRQDNFFDLGGHSLLAARIISRICEMFHVDLPAVAIFENPTIEELAQLVNHSRQSDQPRQTRQGAMPASFAQQRLWFLDQLEPGSTAYNMSEVFRLKGKLDVRALERSLVEVISRHGTLRTTFTFAEGKLFQVVAESTDFRLPLITLRQTAPLEREREARKIAADEAQKPFDLAQGPLIRAMLLQLADEDHLFLCTMHHIVSDGWSMNIFFEELSSLYQACSRGTAATLPQLPMQYADFADWQRSWFEGEVQQRQLAYWREQLAGAPPMLELPTDRPRPVIQTFRGASYSLSLPVETVQKLRVLSRQNRVTLFMVLLSAFKILLYRYSGQDDIVVGAPIAGRNRAEVEGLIGFFVNTIVLRTRLAANLNFAEFLMRVRDTCLGAYANQDLPFEKLVEELHPERDLGRNPLFQVFFNMLTLEQGDFQLDQIRVERVLGLQPEAKFDVTLYVREKATEVVLKLLYNADLFADDRMVECLEQYRSLLMQIADNPHAEVLSYSLVTVKAKNHLPDPKAGLAFQWLGAVHARFSEQAKRVPEQTAVCGERTAWRYRELESLSNRLANFLLASGIQPGEVVAIYACRSVSLVWALLGVLKARAAFLILDSAYPAARLATYLRQVQARGWISLREAGMPPEELRQIVSSPAFRASVEISELDTDGSDHPWFKASDAAAPGVVAPDDPAYVVFTSGTEGRPKAIEGSHAPLSHFIGWHCKNFGLRETDRFSMLSGLAHDPLLRDIFTPLWLGATLYVPDADTVASGEITEWLRKRQISIAHLTPPLAEIIADERNMRDDDGTLPLRRAFFGGDVLTNQHVTQLRLLAPSVQCVNFYGATETPQAMAYFIAAPDQTLTEQNLPLRKEMLPLGQPIADVQLLVLNTARELCGIGELGEIYIRTPYLTQGYIGDEAMNRERFVANPFTGLPDDRTYRTGDLGRYAPDGSIEFAGRHDQQVKIRGFRVELAEIEAVLEQHSHVRGAVVNVHAAAGGKRLVAYVVLAKAAAVNADGLRDFLRQRLPEYMVPSAFVFLDELPLTPNGKVDRRALSSPDVDGSVLQNEFVAPRDLLELELANIWKDVLGVHSIGIRDNFFDLGGHSLLAVRLFAQLQKIFGKKLPLATLFQAPTVEQLARLLRDANWSPSWSSLVAIQPSGSKPPFFCVHAHRGNVLNFNALARCLGADQPFYGLQAQGLDGTRPRHTTIEEMAAHYLEEIRSVQPKGPYLIGGLCFGGKVAFEMAQQLRAQHEEIALLALIDSYAPGHPVLLPWVQRRTGQARLHWCKLKQLDSKERLAYVKEKAGTFGGRALAALKKFTVQAYLALGLSLPLFLRSPVARKRRIPYTPSLYRGKIEVFAPSQAHSVRHLYEPSMGWDGFAAGGCETHIIQGKFASIIAEPAVNELAEHLRAAINKANPASLDQLCDGRQPRNLSALVCSSVQSS